MILLLFLENIPPPPPIEVKTDKPIDLDKALDYSDEISPTNRYVT